MVLSCKKQILIFTKLHFIPVRTDNYDKFVYKENNVSNLEADIFRNETQSSA